MSLTYRSRRYRCDRRWVSASAAQCFTHARDLLARHPCVQQNAWSTEDMDYIWEAFRTATSATDELHASKTGPFYLARVQTACGVQRRHNSSWPCCVPQNSKQCRLCVNARCRVLNFAPLRPKYRHGLSLQLSGTKASRTIGPLQFAGRHASRRSCSCPTKERCLGKIPLELRRFPKPWTFPAGVAQLPPDVQPIVDVSLGRYRLRGEATFSSALSAYLLADTKLLLLPCLPFSSMCRTPGIMKCRPCTCCPWTEL